MTTCEHQAQILGQWIIVCIDCKSWRHIGYSTWWEPHDTEGTA